MEIVSEPDMESAEEAFAYLLALKQIMIYAGVSDCNLEQGNLRCDINCSVRPEGQERLGVHGVHVVDAVEERRGDLPVAKRAADDVEDYRAAKAADVHRPGRRLGVVDDLRPVNRGGQLVGPVHRVRPCPSDRRGGGRTGRASRRRGAGAQLIFVIV